MFGNLLDGRQNAVWHLWLEGKILQNYENRTKSIYLILESGCLLWVSSSSIGWVSNFIISEQFF